MVTVLVVITDAGISCNPGTHSCRRQLSQSNAWAAHKQNRAGLPAEMWCKGRVAFCSHRFGKVKEKHWQASVWDTTAHWSPAQRLSKKAGYGKEESESLLQQGFSSCSPFRVVFDQVATAALLGCPGRNWALSDPVLTASSPVCDLRLPSAACWINCSLLVIWNAR